MDIVVPPLLAYIIVGGIVLLVIAFCYLIGQDSPPRRGF